MVILLSLSCIANMFEFIVLFLCSLVFILILLVESGRLKITYTQMSVFFDGLATAILVLFNLFCLICWFCIFKGISVAQLAEQIHSNLIKAFL